MPKTRQKRILMLTNSVYGRDVRVRRYAEYLAADGVRTDVICLADEHDSKQSDNPMVGVYPLPFKRQRTEGVHLALTWLRIAFMMFLYSAKLCFRYRYDLVHIHNMPDFLVFSAIFPRLLGRPMILNVHDPCPELGRSKLKAEESHPVIRAMMLQEKLSIAVSSHIVTASPAFKKIIMRRGAPEKKITIIMNAADERFFSPQTEAEAAVAEQRADEFGMLYVGTVARRYGVVTCVRALPLLQDKIPNAKLHIYPKIKGEGAGLDECIALAEELGVSARLEVHDPAPLEQMPGIMRSMNVGLYTVVRDCHMDYALSLKIPEMASVGLPIISSNIPVLEELYGQDAVSFIPPEDPQALADAALALHNDPALRERMAENAKARSREFAWAHQYARYCELLDSIWPEGWRDSQ